MESRLLGRTYGRNSKGLDWHLTGNECRDPHTRAGPAVCSAVSTRTLFLKRDERLVWVAIIQVSMPRAPRDTGTPDRVDPAAWTPSPRGDCVARRCSSRSTGGILEGLRLGCTVRFSAAQRTVAFT